MAAPHRRLGLFARLCRQGRQAGAVLEGQRPVPARKLADRVAGTAGSGRLRDGHRISGPHQPLPSGRRRSEEHTSELQSLMRISYAVFCLKKKKTIEYILNLILTTPT